jgi:NADH:ubiquinone reductase (H+-translocating)
MPQPRIVIVGGGFGGLAAAKSLRNTPAEITLIDRANHHLFQPLLYQVATAVLTPSEIATPIRSILNKQKNTTVILGEVTGVDKERQCVFVTNADREGVPVAYDYLILASGATHSYFGHNEFEKFAPGLKSVADAVSARNKPLQAFEQAEAEEDPSRHKILADAGSIRRKSDFSEVLTRTAKAPAISTPVGPAPTRMKVNSSRFS